MSGKKMVHHFVDILSTFNIDSPGTLNSVYLLHREYSGDVTFGVNDETSETKYMSELDSDFSKKMEKETLVAEVPLSIQSIITQSDASGNQVRRHIPDHDSTPPPEILRRPSSRMLSFPESSFLNRLFCDCLSRKKRSDRNAVITNTESSTASHLAALNSGQGGHRSSLRNPSTGQGRPLPLSVPDMGDIIPKYKGKKLLALDLDETLVHSSFQPVRSANYIIPVNIDGTTHSVYVIKRPGVDEFIQRVSEFYEVVVYTASLSKYADPLLDELDKSRLISKRLFRENCVFYNGHYVKDLSLFTNRDLSQTIIIDNSPMSYIFQPENAIDCSSFIDSPTDIEMWQIADFLVAIKDCEDVRKYCRRWREWCQQHPSQIP